MLAVIDCTCQTDLRRATFWSDKGGRNWFGGLARLKRILLGERLRRSNPSTPAAMRTRPTS